MPKTKRKKSRLSAKSAGWGGKRARAGRKPKPFSEAADVLLESGRQGSRKAGLVEVAKRRYKSVVGDDEEGLGKAMERVRKAYEDRAPDLEAAIEATSEVSWPAPALDGDGMLGDDPDGDSRS